MPNRPDRSIEQLGLLASGSSGRWDIAVDEALDRDEWFLEINGRQTYLNFRISDPKIIPEALRFLNAGPRPGQYEEDKATLTLGQFGSVSESLRWDNED